ncbi:DUF763 domain-containing protein [Stetteria hydrogenophila]
MPGIAELPLHGGHVPEWMLRHMKRLAKAIVEYIVEVRGPRALVEGLSDPVWFQAFNNVIGMDWDSSGSTTVLTGILREVSREGDYGFLVLGGKGRAMRSVPEEAGLAERLGADPGEVVRFSKLAARIDSALVQDGYDLYHHAVIVGEGGLLLVVQQGMNTEARLARRYHVARQDLEEPHSGVAGIPGRAILNATGRESREARRAYLDIVSEGPRRFERLLWEAYRKARGLRGLDEYLAGTATPRPAERAYTYRPVRPDRRLVKAVEEVYKFNPTSEVELALAPRLGPVLVRALALIADLVYSIPTGTSDPVTHPLNPYLYAYAVGGKDGVPRRFDPKTAVMAARLIEEAVESARLGEKDKLRALSRLRHFLRARLGVEP